MNNHAKRLVKELETLGFRRDYDAKTRGRAYRHPNQPDQIIKVFDAMSDTSITAAKRMANKIADTGWSGPRMPATIKERATIRRRKERAEQERQKAAVEARAAEAERIAEVEARVRREDARRHEIESLMMPGRGR